MFFSSRTFIPQAYQPLAHRGAYAAKKTHTKKKPKDFSYSLYHTNKKSRKKRKVQKEELSRIAPFLG